VTKTSDWQPSKDGTGGWFGVHARMRQECPVAYSDDFGGFWSVFKYDDIVAVARDTDTFISTPAVLVPPIDVGVPFLPLQSDPPAHRDYRMLLTPLFRGSRLRQFEATLADLTNARIDTFADRASADVSAELCVPVPAGALCLLMGLPPEAWTDLRHWSLGIVHASASGDRDAVMKIFREMFEFVDEWVERRRARPADDLISVLLAARVGGEPLSTSELRGIFLIMLTAGHMTSTTSMNNALAYLARNESAQAQLRAHPDQIGDAVDELLRFAPPVQGLARTASRRTELGGRTIEAGERVVLVFGSGSRDEDVFEQTDECIFDRGTRDHLTFGTGIHRCLGEHLARLELRIVLTEFLRRFSHFELAGTPELDTWPGMGYLSLPLRLSVAV
jgi:cytochrome P450